jgi:hypothetical protein
MKAKSVFHSIGRCVAGGIGLAAASYATVVGVTWMRYGAVAHAAADEESDALLDRFMPTYEVVERHRVLVRAPAETTFAAACEMDLERSRIIRAVFKGREWFMGSEAGPRQKTRAFVPQMLAIGWGRLAELPGREIVMGSVTQPWLADVVFRPLPPERFAAFDDPDHVKIAWTLRVDPAGAGESIFRTETRVTTTDATARRRFRRYWSRIAPGVVLIRWMSLRLVKAEAERRSRETTGSMSIDRHPAGRFS